MIQIKKKYDNPYELLNKFTYDIWVDVYWEFVEFCKKYNFKLNGVGINEPRLKNIVKSFHGHVEAQYSPYYTSAWVAKKIVGKPFKQKKGDITFPDGNRRMAVEYISHIMDMCGMAFKLTKKESIYFKENVRFMTIPKIEKYIKNHCMARNISLFSSNNTPMRSWNHTSNSSLVIDNNKTYNNINLSNNNKPRQNPLLSITGLIQTLALGASAGFMSRYFFRKWVERKPVGIKINNPPQTESEIVEDMNRLLKSNPATALSFIKILEITIAILASGLIQKKWLLKKPRKNPAEFDVLELFSVENLKKIADLEDVRFNVTSGHDNFKIMVHGEVAEMLYGILEDSIENPTLSIPVKDKNAWKHISKAESELKMAGVAFDTGYDMSQDIRDWELDYSLEGAEIRNPHLNNINEESAKQLTDLFTSLYKTIKMGYKKETGKEFKEYKMFNEKAIFKFFNNFPHKRKNLLAQATYFLSRMIILHPLPNANYRTSIMFLRKLLLRYNLKLPHYDVHTHLQDWIRNSDFYISQSKTLLNANRKEKTISREELKQKHDELTELWLQQYLGEDQSIICAKIYDSLLAISKSSALKRLNVSSSVINNNNIQHNINNLSNKFILITAPHTKCTKQLRKNHECDTIAADVTGILYNALADTGYNVIALVNKTSRKDVDMNRRESRDTRYRKTLSNLLEKQPAFLIDMHSYPPQPDEDHFEKYDVVLYNIPNITNLDILTKMKKKLQAQHLKIGIHKADATGCDIVTESYLRGVEAVLVECNEKYKGFEEVIGTKLVKTLM